MMASLHWEIVGVVPWVWMQQACPYVYESLIASDTPDARVEKNLFNSDRCLGSGNAQAAMRKERCLFYMVQ